MVPLGVRQLECFVAVAEELHIGRAAARLHMTQPPLTRRMSRLEREIGATLFRRTPRGVELTAAGDVLLERGHHILKLAADAVERTQSAAGEVAGSLVVGYGGATVLDLVPSMLAGFLHSRPHVSLTLTEIPKPQQLDAIQDGRIHIGIGCRYPSRAGIAVRELLRESFQLAVPSDHRLAGCPAVGIDELSGERIVLYPAAERPSFADEVVSIFSRHGVVIRPVKLADKLTDALAYVAISRMCAIVGRTATTVAMRGVSYVPLRDSPLLPVDCVSSSEDPPAVVRDFLAHLDLYPSAILTGRDPAESPPCSRSPGVVVPG